MLERRGVNGVQRMFFLLLLYYPLSLLKTCPLFSVVAVAVVAVDVLLQLHHMEELTSESHGTMILLLA